MSSFEEDMAHNAANDRAEAACTVRQNEYEVACIKYATAERMGTPSFMLKPRLCIDGNQWCALYGENLQDGVAGFGDSPDLAYLDFDKNWVLPLPHVANQNAPKVAK